MDRDTFNRMNQRLVEITGKKKKERWKSPSGDKYFDQTVVPEHLKENHVALQSITNGNCLYSAASILICGNDDLTDPLRFLTSWELHHNSDFYADHPLLDKTLTNGSDTFTNVATIFSNYISEDTFERSYDPEKRAFAVRAEAMYNLRDTRYPAFISVLALSSVIERGIEIYYSSPPKDSKYAKLYNHFIMPRGSVTNDGIDICWISTNKNDPKPNHFVPISRKIESVEGEFKRLHLEQDSDFECSRSPLMSSAYSLVSSPQQLPNIETIAEAAESLPIVPEPISPEPITIAATGTTPFPHPSVGSKFDIGLHYDKIDNLSPQQKLELIDNVWRPGSDFSYPKTKGRKFCEKWFDEFPGLCYSEVLDGAFCLPCVMFGKLSPKSSTLRNLFTQPLKVWPSACDKLVTHFGTHKVKTGEDTPVKSKCDIHIHSCLTFATFINRMRRNASINILIDTQLKDVRQKNRLIMKSIIDTVIFMGRNNIPFRGHRDDSKYHAEVGEQSEGQVGIFQNMLNFRVANGDKVLEEHLRSAARNAMYTSAPIQNELIEACGAVIQRKIAARVVKAKFFSVLADEATDISNKYQLAFLLRYVDDDTEEIREDFIKFIECEDGTTGEDISKYLLTAVRNDLGLDMNSCRGQGYDAGGNMAGCHKGAATLIANIYPQAVYFHCACHRLNLCVEQTCSVQQVELSMARVKELTYFFNLVPKRNICLEKHIEEENGKVTKRKQKKCPVVKASTEASCEDQKETTLTRSPNKYDPGQSGAASSGKSKLLDVCRTRWSARIEGMGLFQSLFPPIIHTLDEMYADLSDRWSRDTRQKAGNHLKGLMEFSFLVGLVIGRRVLDYLESITILLQKRAGDVLAAYIMVNEVKARIKNVSENMDEFHGDWYAEIVELASKCDIEESSPRQPAWSKFREHIPSPSVKEYWKRTVTIPMVSHLRTTLDTRFNEKSSLCAKAFQIVPSIMLTDTGKDNDWKTNFMTFFRHYVNDMPSPTSIDAELDIWYGYWKSVSPPDLPSTVSETLHAMQFVRGAFPNIHTSLRILATIPVTSCECERSISQLRMIKTYTRNTMCNDRLNGLALLHMHKDISVTAEEVLEEFMKVSRRIDL